MAIWDFAWVSDPSAWAGLGTLILIEIVLGIDNIVFIQPIMTLMGHDFSWRDIILIIGGIFLLLKGTMEMHERLEGQIFDPHQNAKHHAVFWQVITQIVILDAIFSIPSKPLNVSDLLVSVK